MIDFDKNIKLLIPNITKKIRHFSQISSNESEFRTKITNLIDDVSQKVKLTLSVREEYSLINGRADAVYNRLIIEYEPPRSLKGNNSARTNRNAINQLKNYIDGLVRRTRHQPERIAGVVLDGTYFIFVRKKQDIWHIEEPLKVDDYSVELFLKLLFSLSTEKALIPENLIEDFGENTIVSRKVMPALFSALIKMDNPRVKILFEQWSIQFNEVCDYEGVKKLNIESFAKNFNITQNLELFPFFFSLHTYYAIFIKLLALKIILFYASIKYNIDLKQIATSGKNELKEFLEKVENGSIFKNLGIANFIEGDFFTWYLDIWNDQIYDALKTLISTIANYSFLTLDIDPDITRDLLKKLYQQIVPKKIRHNLGEYYTPDWLAERLLNMIEGGKFKGNPDKRILDPACGSGTFLVIAIKKICEYAKKNSIPEDKTLQKILSNVVGFDLNPLAVISARTNYLLALGELLQYRKEEINIPVYLCDSILTPFEVGDIFEGNVVKFNTSVGQFKIPVSLVKAQYIDQLSNSLEEWVKLDLGKAQFNQKICDSFPLNPSQDEKDIEVLWALYDKLLLLQKQGINGIWARIIKNAFAPLFAGEFDYIVGNPPWVNWENLPENYRRETKPLWFIYNLFPHRGMDTILGKGKKDISMIMTYVSLDKYLKKNGKLGFLITQSVFKTAGAGQGFRKFELPDKTPICVLHVDDMVKLKTFEGASNRTSLIILQKGKPTKYPIKSYLYWKKTVKRKSIPQDATLEEVLKITETKRFIAEPVNVNDLTSPWLTGRPKALKAIRKILGKSDYIAREGVNSGGTNAVFWVNKINKRPDGLVVISNITEGAKVKVNSVQTTIEPDLLYPLLRGRDVKRWKAEPSAYIIMTQDPNKRRGLDETVMKNKYPKTYLYLKNFETVLRNRRAHKKYFIKKERKTSRIIETGPFYSMFDVGNYTFTPYYKVVWTRLSSIEAAIVHRHNMKIVIPQETLTFVDLDNEKEAYYLCAMINSSVFQYACISYSQAGGKSMGSPHILENIRIPKFDPDNKLHLKLAELSENAHQLAKMDNLQELKKVEEDIDKISAQIWGLTAEELEEIKKSLEELI